MDINFIKVCFIRKLIRNSVFLSLQKKNDTHLIILYISDELGFDLPGLMKKLEPSLFHPEPEIIKEYYASRLYADFYDEDRTINSLRNACSDMEKYILPYFHRFADLEYFYAEESETWNFADPVHYGLSLKLHHYEDALHCIEYRISDCRRIMADHVQTQNRLKVFLCGFI